MSALEEYVGQKVASRFALTANVAMWTVIVVTVALFSHTLLALGRVWVDSADYQHGWLVGVSSIALLYRSRRLIAAAPYQPTSLALVPTAVVLLAWAVAYRANSEMLQQMLFPLVILLAILAACGPAIARIAAFPILFFYFAIPVWNQLAPVLQWMCTVVSEQVLAAVGVPTQVEGFNVTIPAGQFSIVEGCSGKRYLIIALALATFACGLQTMRARRWIEVMAFAAACALVTNWLRIIIIIYAGHVSNMQHYLVAVEHLSLGYALYAPMIAAIIWYARRAGIDAVQAPPDRRLELATAQLARGVVGPVALCALAAVLILTTQRMSGQPSLLPPPLLAGNFQGPLPAQASWRPRYQGAAAEYRTSYRTGDARRVEVYANVYGVQAEGRELVGFANSILPTGNWTVVREADVGRELDAYVATSSLNDRWVIGQAYRVGTGTTRSAGVAQLLYGWSALWRPTPSGVIAVAVACKDDCEVASRTLTAFWAENAAALSAMIPEAL